MFTKAAVMTATINFRDRNNQASTFEFGIKLGGAVTEAVARTYVLDVASALQACSCAMVVGTVLRRAATDMAALPPAGGSYRNVEDNAPIRIQPVDGQTPVRIALPAPKAALFMPDKVNLDPVNAELQDFLTWAAGKLVDYGFHALIRYMDGSRGNSEYKAIPADTLVLD